MKLAFSGEARYPDFKKGYELYVKRSKTGNYMDFKTYKRVIRKYCMALADRLYEKGYIELPAGLGAIMPITIDRKAQYRGNKFVGYGKMDWEKGHYDGSSKAFGITFLPRRRKNDSLRCYGFVANRKLFRKVKEWSSNYQCKWKPLQFNDEMI